MSTRKTIAIPGQQPSQAHQGGGLARDVSNKSEESLLSRSLGFAGSDMLAALQRRSSETTCICHSGYLLKRSNKPFHTVESSSEQSGSRLAPSPPPSQMYEDVDTAAATDGTDQADAGGQDRRASQQPQHDVVKDVQSDKGATASDNSSTMEETIDLVAAFFGCDAGEDGGRRESTSPTLNGDKIERYSPLVLSPPDPKPNEASGGQPSTEVVDAVDKRGGIPVPIYHRLNSAPAAMRPSTLSTEDMDDTSHSGQSPPPADYIDPTDGHIWRAKYCVLEDGVLYFYRNAKDGNSIEAQVEREQMSLFHHGGHAPSHSKAPAKLDDLSKSPMAGQVHPLLHSHEQGTAGSFCYDANVIWEKRVALDSVGEVRSAELEYGEKSFELLAVDYEDNPKTLDDDNLGDADDSSSTCKMADRLILRSGSTEEMNEWLFQFHRSLASFMKQIVELVGSDITGVGDLHFPGEPYHTHGMLALAPPQTRGNGAVPIPMIPPAVSGGGIAGTIGSHSPSAQNGAGTHGSTAPAALSHGHGRSGLHRRRIRVKYPDQAPKSTLTSPMSTPGGGASPTLSHDWEPSSIPRKSRAIVVSGGVQDEFSGYVFRQEEAAPDGSKPGDIVSSPPRPFRKIADLSGVESNLRPSENSSLVTSVAPPSSYSTEIQKPPLDVPVPAKASKYIPPHLRGGKQSGGLTQSLSAGKYVPPHLRGNRSGPLSSKTEGTAVDNSLLPGAEATVDDASQAMFDMTVDDAPKPARPESSNEVQYMGHSDGFGIGSMDEDGVESMKTPLEEHRKHGGRSEISHFMRGGCADPKVAIGSILDSMYVPRSASKIGKVHSKGYGGVGGGKPSHIRKDFGTTEERPKNIHWEVGAISECGIRESNEDSYIISHDLVAALAALPSSEGTQDDNIEDKTATHTESDSTFDTEIPLAAQHHGLFAIFDGHCGNQAARYAVEKLPSFIFDEYKKLSADASISPHEYAERILSDAIKRLDEEFCHLCTADGREWESGATAIVTLVIGDVITIANVGDSRGVMCMSSSLVSEEADIFDERHKAKGWSLLEEDEKNKTNHLVYWKEVTDSHSPGREDERRRIEEANGWITTETEIPISQLQRMDFLDKDVVEILKRCFSDRFDNDPLSDPHRAGKKCSAEPGRLLHISRVCGELAVSRAIGDRDFKAAFNMPSDSEVLASAAVSAQNVDAESSEAGWECPLFLPYPDKHSRRFDGDLVSGTPEVQVLRAGGNGVFDEFLLLACDGLWDVMDSDDAVRVARDLLFEKGWSAQKAAARLAELAMHLGSSDNITVILIRFFSKEKGNLQA